MTATQFILIAVLLTLLFWAGWGIGRWKKLDYGFARWHEGFKEAEHILNSRVKDYREGYGRILREFTEYQKNSISLTTAEVQSGFTRVKWAEGLIKQLPDTHEGRNSWLLNYGTRECQVCEGTGIAIEDASGQGGPQIGEFCVCPAGKAKVQALQPLS